MKTMIAALAEQFLGDCFTTLVLISKLLFRFRNFLYEFMLK